MKKTFTNFIRLLTGKKGTVYLIICMAAAFSLTSCKKHTAVSGLQKQKAMADSIMRHIDDTTAVKLQMEKYHKEKNLVGEMMALKRLGKIYREGNRYFESIDCHQKEMEISKELGDTIDMVQALNDIGTNFRRLGILDEASNYHYLALKISNAYSDKNDKVAKKNKVKALNGIGNICLTLNDNITADSVFRAALAGEKELGSDLGLAINYANLGSLFQDKGQTDSAWVYYRQSMKHNKAAGSDLGIALCHNYFGRLYEEAGNMARAEREYKRSYAIMTEKADRWHWLESCLALAKVYVNSGDTDHARRYLAEAKEEAEKQGSVEHLATIYTLYYELYKKQGNSHNALACYEKSREFSDSVLNEKDLIHMQNVRIKYEYDKRQAEIDTLNNDYMTERAMKKLSVAILVIIIMLAITVISFLWYALKMRKRKQRMMQQTESMRTSFFTNITHEFRTPLTVILGYSAQMQEGKIKPEALSHTGEIITRQGKQLLSLINQLLDISRIKSAVGKPNWQHGNIVRFVSMLTESFIGAAERKGVKVEHRHEGDVTDIDFVPDYAQKIIANLMSNALKFTPQGGDIIITTAVKQGKFLLRVEDHGIGMSEEDCKHIFEMFYQSNNKLMSLGSGVGLTLVKQIVDSLNGKISVESHLGKGTTFTIQLPTVCSDKSLVQTAKSVSVGSDTILEAETGSPAKAPAMTDDSEEADADSGRPIILVVEDNEDVTEYMCSCLGDEYDVRVAKDGEVGLEKASKIVPDIVITDLMMPKKDGLQLCEDIRQSDILCHIPVVMVTAKSSKDDKLEGLKTGADAYINKPFSAEELLLTINNLLERQKLMRKKFAKAAETVSLKTTATDSGTPSESKDHLPEREEAFIAKLNAIIDDNMLHGDISVDTIASLLCMTGQQLRRKLFSITGETPAYYIKRAQMYAAKRIMDANAGLSISDVAGKCGFYDTSHFTRSFKNIFGITPTQYRRDGLPMAASE